MYTNILSLFSLTFRFINNFFNYLYLLYIKLYYRLCIFLNKNTKNFKKRPRRPKWKKFLIKLVNSLKSLLWGTIGMKKIPNKFINLFNFLPFIHPNPVQGFAFKSAYNKQISLLQFSINLLNSRKHRRLLKSFKQWIGYGKIKSIRKDKNFIKYYVNINNCYIHYKILSIIYSPQLSLRTRKFFSASYNFALSKFKYNKKKGS